MRNHRDGCVDLRHNQIDRFGLHVYLQNLDLPI